MNWFVLITIVMQLIVGICAGLGAATYLFWRKWFMKRLRDVENDVEDMYIMHGITPPAVSRARHELGLDRNVFDDADLPGPPDD